MGGIGLGCTQSSHIRTHMYAHTYAITHTYICIPCTTIMHLHRIQNTHICSITMQHITQDKTKHIYTCTQYAHTQNTERRYNNTTHKYICSTRQTQNNAQNNAQNRIQNTAHSTQHSTQNSTYDLHTYSLDYYHEYAYIKNSNTIELYTISKENI